MTHWRFTICDRGYEAVQLSLQDGQFTMDQGLFQSGRHWWGRDTWLVRALNEEYAWPMANTGWVHIFGWAE